MLMFHAIILPANITITTAFHQLVKALHLSRKGGILIYQTEQTLGLKSENLLAWPLIDSESKTIGLLVLLDLNVIDNEAALTEFCRMAASNIRQAECSRALGLDCRH